MKNSNFPISSYNEKINELIQITNPESSFIVDDISICDKLVVPKFTRELWTSKQRQGHSLHEISYRACFKPQLPNYFIKKFSHEGDVVYDPFGGRGTTVLEAGLLGRKVINNDINPLSKYLVRPRLNPPTIDEIRERLRLIPTKSSNQNCDIDLSMFYHKDTFSQLLALKSYFLEREKSNTLDYVDDWLRMVALNRLTGHSPGFFSVYTLPPNQATTPDRQIKINAKYGNKPEFKDTHHIILEKSRQLISDLSTPERLKLARASKQAIILSNDARKTPEIPDEYVWLTITSPPFLDIVQYANDNWLRCWFVGLDADFLGQRITTPRSIAVWQDTMRDVFLELFRITRPGGHVVFEVGEVRKGSIRLEEVVVPLGDSVGFEAIGVLINEQVFTKTSNIWGVENNQSGTNSNRIALFRKK